MTKENNKLSNDSNLEEKKSWLSWLFWWKIDPRELEEQLTQYNNLRFYKTARGLSFLLILLSAIITMFICRNDGVVVIISNFICLMPFILLGIFIFFGHC